MMFWLANPKYHSGFSVLVRRLRHWPFYRATHCILIAAATATAILQLATVNDNHAPIALSIPALDLLASLLIRV